jgi:hypothetical protein
MALKFFSVVLLFGAFSGGLSKFPVVPDTPYEEIIAHRFTGEGISPVFGWGTLPFSTPVQVRGLAILAILTQRLLRDPFKM